MPRPGRLAAARPASLLTGAMRNEQSPAKLHEAIVEIEKREPPA